MVGSSSDPTTSGSAEVEPSLGDSPFPVGDPPAGPPSPVPLARSLAKRSSTCLWRGGIVAEASPGDSSPTALCSAGPDDASWSISDREASVTTASVV